MNKIKFIKSFVLVALVLLFIGFIQAQPAHAISGNEAYEELMATTTAEEMRTVLLTLADERIEELGAMTPSQLNNIRNHVDSLDILTENDISIKEEIHETLDILESIVQGNSEVSTFTSGYNSVDGYIYASQKLANNVRTTQGHTVAYKSNTDTVRITANGAYNDPQILINLSSYNIGTETAWSNEYKYMVVVYRCSGDFDGDMFMSYIDANTKPNSNENRVQDFQSYTSFKKTNSDKDRKFYGVESITLPDNQVYDSNSNPEYNFNYIVFDLSKIGAAPNDDGSHGTGWANSKFCKEIRIDYTENCLAGDWFEIDAIGFCKENGYPNSDRAYSDNLKKEYFIWERTSIRNNRGKFSACKEMLTLFDSYHSCTGAYDEEEEALVFTMATNDQQGNRICTDPDTHVHPGIGFACNAHLNQGAFDPGVMFHVPGGLSSSKYGYLVLTYKAVDTNPETDMFDDIIFQSKFSGDNALSSARESNCIDVGIYPTNADGIEINEYRRNFQIYQQEIYYSEFVSLKTEGQTPNVINRIRIDPFNVHYSKVGAQLHIASIHFVRTPDEAKDIIEQEIKNKYPYGYLLKYDSNKPAGATGTVANIPDTQSLLHSKETKHTFNLSNITPTLLNYTFIGWSYSQTSDVIIKEKSITIDGDISQTVEITLYAVWALQATTLHYTVETPQGVTSEYGSLSVKEELVGITEERPNGTILTLNIGFKLEGWYDSGGNKVSSDLVFKPIKGTSNWVETTFKAKIVYESIVFRLSIKEGKFYDSLTDTKTSVNILQNSSFTMEVIMDNYYPNVHEDIQIFNFDKVLPKNTKLLLIDFSNSNIINYYIYQILGTENGLKLSDFESIKDNTIKYSDNKVAKKMTKKFLIVGEFSNASIGTYNVGFENYPVQNLLDNTKLTLKVESKRTSSIVDNSTSNLTMNDKLNISYNFTTSAGTGVDTLYTNRNYALYVTPQNFSFPEGSYIEYNGTNFYPTSDNNGIIIPVGSISSSLLELSFYTPYNKLAEDNYALKVTAFISATSNANNPRGGEKVGDITTSFKVEYLKKAINISRPNGNETQVFTKVEAEAGINFVIQTLNINEAELSITLEKLEGSAWVNVNDAFVTTVDFSAVTDTFLVKLKSEKLTGMTTYRLVIKTADNLVQDEFIIIITE